MFGKIKILKTVENGARLSTDNGTIIADIYGINAEDRAAFIVRACNSHDALVDGGNKAVEVFETMTRNMNSAEWEKYGGSIIAAVYAMRAAIALAKGE